MPEFVSKFTMGYRFEPPRIEYEATKEKLTGQAGMGNIVDLFCESAQYEKLRSCIPMRSSNYAYDSIQYALCVLTGFWLGAECLDDLEKYKRDALLVKKLGGKIPTARSIGDWLRDFDEQKLLSARDFLSAQALAYRNHLAPNSPLIIDMDSTSHPQTGQKIEGVGWNYKNEWALDSLSAFCNLGFCYDFKLRPGSTYSSVGAAPMIEDIFTRIKADPVQGNNKNLYYRADSAFCNEAVVRSCLNMGVKFTITAHGNLRWEREAREIADCDWSAWVYTKEEVEESMERGRPLPRIEVASMWHTPSWAENIRFKIVIKRTFEIEQDEGLFHGFGHWEYYGVITNIVDYIENPQAILQHHMQRGSAENRIKAFKGDYDLRHFPCKSFHANSAYGLLGMVALNFHRALSLVDDPSTPHFAKHFRNRLIRIPGRLVQHARALKIKIEEHWLKEVNRLKQAWRAPPRIPLTFHLRIKSASG